ncbi:MAG: aminotransferase class V-fold PLP-dependent enzyme [Coriobacteriia bacterium]|nr:aminotransferase class V-fold PLP-dependent enzyme [Coriobacteriia bacterium]
MIGSLEQERAAFESAHPAYDAAAVALLRAGEYARLDARGQTYLDYTGGGLYAASQVEKHAAILANGVFGNPHSNNPTSLASTALVEAARDAVLRHLNADSAEYDVVFTQNASGALKLVGEAYPFSDDSCYMISFDNHNSVNGIREYAHRAGAMVSYLSVHKPELRLDDVVVAREITRPACGNRLFAYPAQSNFSGVKHSLDWVDLARRRGWDVLLDCAAFAPTNRLDLSVVKPDYVPLSFYKMFGYPTGVGALVARHEALAKLCRPWFAGGTITLASVQSGQHQLAPGHTGFEDGTVDYLGLPAVTLGLAHLAAVGMDSIQDRVMALASWLLRWMRDTTHANGAPLVRVFGPSTTDARGSTIAFYLLDPEGDVHDVDAIEARAGEEGISVRTGCFCNPGDGEIAHNITASDMEACFDHPQTEPTQPVTLQQCQRLIEDASGKVPNTIRASLGIASDFGDVWRFARFAEGYLDRPVGPRPVR